MHDQKGKLDPERSAVNHVRARSAHSRSCSRLLSLDQVADTVSLTHGSLLTEILNRWRDGSRVAGEEVARELVPRLRRLARSYCRQERPDLTLDPTEVVHEAWLTLIKCDQPLWKNRGHFFGYAARLMRQCLIQHARRRSRIKRGGGQEHVRLDGQMSDQIRWKDLLDLNNGLRKLSELDPKRAQVVELRYFVGLSFDEIGQALGIGRATAFRRWRAARAWLRHELSHTYD